MTGFYLSAAYGVTDCISGQKQNVVLSYFSVNEIKELLMSLEFFIDF